MALAVSALVVAVLAYGWSGLALAAGSRSAGGALRSPSWWLGTGLQGVGFVTALLARTMLPLLLVQSAIAAALVVTAVLEHASGVRRLPRRELLPIAAVVAGVGAIGAAVVPGPTRPATPGDAAWLVGGLVIAAALVAVLRSPGGLGALAGAAFCSGAVAGRLLVGSGTPLADVARFWNWPALTWVIAACLPAAIVVGQWALTRGLARGRAVATLGGNYLVATLVPSLFGLVMVGEHLRDGLWALAVAGVGAAVWGTRRLLLDTAT